MNKMNGSHLKRFTVSWKTAQQRCKEASGVHKQKLHQDHLYETKFALFEEIMRGSITFQQKNRSYLASC